MKSNTKAVNILTILSIAFGIFQTMLLTAPFHNPENLTIASAITIFIVSALTTWKQLLSVEIANKAIWPTITVAIIATLGGLTDLLGVFHLPDSSWQWIRWGITFVTAVLNILSKQLWSTPDTKSLI